MDRKLKKDFSVAFLLQDNNNNDSDCAYSSKSSSSSPNWNSVSTINNTAIIPTQYWLSGQFEFSGKDFFYLFVTK
jgi:hypothetical protein